MKSSTCIIGIIGMFSFLLCFSACQSQEEILREQYVVEGMGQYERHCENCHQKDGSGLKDLYPPLAKTDVWKRLSAYQLTCIIKYGQKDTIVVNQKVYQNYMPGNTKLEALDIAELITYMREKWGDDKRIFPLDSARLALKNCH
ncbi:c-type cytochrome [Aquirufa rosea]|uniref:C-type cytochrome n=1 Tax=Aquirufa rosea TaxID=2509241 RepID=A0A4V1M5H8_9BACT|nr:cytochrome c [Aquirufa rosea]RXK49764.1 c-type cytochrome [Aquirufa rosea]